jgi:putative NIF3 family GTP cyclohydrolase 1 type 2
MTRLSRREFGALVATGTIAGHVSGPFAANQQLAAQPVTADGIIERIKKNIGVEWLVDTVDTVKAGDPSTRVSGIVTTALATMAVLQQAVKLKANMVITCGPTFYSRADARIPPAGRGVAVSEAAPANDPVFTAKNEFIARNNLVVFRLSDHWRMRKPDPLAQGLAAALGWTKNQPVRDPLHVDIPVLTLEALARHLNAGLRAGGGVRVVGDARTTVSRVGLLAGTTPIQLALKTLPHVDAIIAGEVREWESVEYARDVVFSGQKKGLVLVGRVASEEPGMEICSNWLRMFVPEVPVRHISAGDPYWRPA